MINVLHVIKLVARGGATHGLLNTARYTAELDKVRHRVVSLTPAEPEAEKQCHNMSIPLINSPDRATLVREIERADIVQVHFWNTPDMYEFLLSDLPPMRLLIRFNVNGYHAPHAVTHQLVQFADFVLASNPYVYDHPVLRSLPADRREDKVGMIYASAEFRHFNHFKKKDHLTYNVGYIGTVDFIKMHPDYVKISAGINVPKIQFLVCGKGADLKTLQQQAVELDAAARFKFYGYVDNIKSIYEITDVFGYPLCKDNYSTVELVLQEVMYLGIPPVIFPYGGAQRTVENNYSGLIVSNDREYCEAIAHLYHDPKLRHQLGENAKKSTRQRFGQKMSAGEYINLYKRMMTRPKRYRKFSEAGIPDVSGSTPSISDKKMLSEKSSGTRLLLKSLGDTAPQFKTSYLAADPVQVKEADHKIGRSSHLLFRHGILAYRNKYPQDSYLRLWAGLYYQEQGDYARAYREYKWLIEQGDEARRAGRYLDKVKRLMNTIDLLELRIEEKSMDKACKLSAMLLKGDKDDRYPPDRIYQIALGFHHEGYDGIAFQYYERLLRRSDLTDDLASWIHFKKGEIFYEKGRPGEAQNHFSMAVHLNPNHAKARILLQPDHAPLNIIMGIEDLEADGYIGVKMDIYDETLWEYYFANRPIDKLIVDVCRVNGHTSYNNLIRLIKGYLKDEGQVQLDLKLRHIKPGIEQIIRDDLEVEGFTVKINNDSILERNQIC